VITFAQSKVQQYIADFRTLSTAQTTAELLQLSEAVLKSIEAQHGLLVERGREIYSFSHLTFQEYFTARNFVANSDPGLGQNLIQLVSHMTERLAQKFFYSRLKCWKCCSSVAVNAATQQWADDC